MKICSAPDVNPSSIVRIPKAGEVVASQLRRRILLGELNEGDTLAPENEMMVQFGVSRPTLREAFRLLEAEGLISISRGTRNGATVHRPSVHIAARYMSFILQANQITFDDVYRTRVMIEPAAIRLVIEHKSADTVRILREINRKIEDAIENDRVFGATVAEFHRKIVELAGISTLTYLMDLVHRVLEIYLSSVAAAASQQMDTSAAKKKGGRAREKLIDLIEADNVAEAIIFWRRHLEVSEKVLLRWHPGTLVPELSSYA
jgi:DNA-binding FadR family transcriptional regulator